MKKRNALSRLREKERDARKSLILDAAERLFATRPFDKVSMQEIADEAGLAKSSIYTYFPTQEDLFVEAAFRDIQALLEDLDGMADTGAAPDLGAVIDAFLDHFERHDSFFRMASLFMLHGTISPESLEKLNPAGRRMMDSFETALRGMGFRGDVRLLSHTLFSALSGILISYRKYPGRTEEEKTTRMKRIGATVRAMLEGLPRDYK